MNRNAHIIFLIMFKGFGNQPIRNDDWVIQNIQENTKALRNDFQFKRDSFVEYWHSLYEDISYDTPPLASLYTPFAQHSCLASETPSKHSVVGHHNNKLIFCANTDFWFITVNRENYRVAGNNSCSVGGRPVPKKKQNHYEFQIGVKVGPYGFFMPNLIKERIHEWHGMDAYNSWRKMVKADLQNLAPYLTAFNPPKHLYSFTCDDSSTRVCESLGLPVKHGVAYWLRQADADFKPEVVAELVNDTAVSGLNLQSCLGQKKVSVTDTVANYLKYGPGNLLDFSNMLEAA